ncbi:hypothetical protein [Helicobacter cetorum]|uniref:hypothetical protein n=1 Tax=Helicobacter cetorum TaxID=138563 RepID=UPI000CF025D9|nr:hypothetical protein [Helicobacter cetorum]
MKKEEPVSTYEMLKDGSSIRAKSNNKSLLKDPTVAKVLKSHKSSRDIAHTHTYLDIYKVYGVSLVYPIFDEHDKIVAVAGITIVFKKIQEKVFAKAEHYHSFLIGVDQNIVADSNNPNWQEQYIKDYVTPEQFFTLKNFQTKSPDGSDIVIDFIDSNTKEEFNLVLQMI